MKVLAVAKNEMKAETREGHMRETRKRAEARHAVQDGSELQPCDELGFQGNDIEGFGRVLHFAESRIGRP
jgi:hypothetical protein